MTAPAMPPPLPGRPERPTPSNPLPESEKRKNVQGAIVVFGLALLCFLIGVVSVAERGDAVAVDGTIVELDCGLRPTAEGSAPESERCVPTVSYEHEGETKLLRSRLHFERGKLEVGQTIQVDVNAYPIEVISDSHYYGWLFVSVLGSIILGWIGVSMLVSDRSMVSDTPLPDDYLPEDDER